MAAEKTQPNAKRMPGAVFDAKAWLAMEEHEPILKEDKSRHIAFPVKYSDIFKLADKAEESIWPRGDIDVSGDKKHWDALNEQERHFLKRVLAFFASADGIVAENLAVRFYGDVKVCEIRKFYAQQIQQEHVHNEVYSMLIETYINNPTERNELFVTMQDIPVIKKMREWMESYIRSGSCFAERLVAFACVEAILFSAAFCAIYYFRKRGILPALMLANDRIARDEGLHANFAAAIYQLLEYTRLPFEKVKEIISRAVDLQRAFVKDAIPVAMIGMSCPEMIRYVEYVADLLVHLLGYKEDIYGTQNPFDWMLLQSLGGKTNFFENRVPDYNRIVNDNSLSSMPKGGNHKALNF